MNLYSNLMNMASKDPEKEAYSFADKSTTYKQLNSLVEKFSQGLSQQGIKKGDHVALLLGNTPDFVIAYYGVLRLGGTVVPINPTFTPREIQYILLNSKAKGIVAVSTLQPILQEIAKETPYLDTIVYTEALENELSIHSFLENAVSPVSSATITEEDIAVVLYTSGTTGVPKGVMLTHKNLHSNAESCIQFLELTKDDRIVTVLPLFHVFCMTICMNASILAGATMIMIPSFSPVELIEKMNKNKATIFAGVPTMYNFLLQVATTGEKLQSLRLCVSGGASLPLAVLDKFKQLTGLEIKEGYGLSEASPATAFNPLRGKSKPGSIGVNIPFVENKIVDDNGAEVKVGEIGELIVRGPNVMKGYLGMPEETAQAIKNGWLYTGDLAKMDSDGYIYIVDRKKDLIIVGGYNVYPREIEELLYAHPDIVEAAVIGVPDEHYGEAIKAFVVTKNNDLNSEEVKNYLEDKLVKYKQPKIIEFIAQLPKNATGKIVKKELREIEISKK